MYAYGNPMPSGRQRSGNKDQRSITEMMSGSCANNAGPAMYDRDAYRNRDGQGSQRGSNNDGQTNNNVHPDLQWGSPKLGQSQNATGEWVAQQSNAGWGGNDGNNSTNNASAWENNNNDGNTWGKTEGNGSNGSNHSNSNKSQKSSKSNSSKKSSQPPAGDSTNWDGDANNVGMSSGASNTSKDSKGSRKSASPNGGAADFDNNAGPTQAAADDWSKPDSQKNDQGSGDPSNNMPGAWEKENQGGGYGATFVPTGPPKDTGGFSWGDSSAAQGNIGGGGDGTTW